MLKTASDSSSWAMATLPPELRDRFSGPMDTATGLPNAAYTSPAFFALEQERLFAAAWLFAGRAGELPEPGDALPMLVANTPIALVRGADAEVRAFHNVCPHRGARLVPERRAGAETLVCPYHSWTFELDGRLRARPHFRGPGSHDLADCANSARPKVWPVRTARWLDWVFVNLDGHAPDFDAWMRPVRERVSAYRLDRFQFDRSMRFEFRCNWKLALENFTDEYHVFKVHPDLDRLMHSSDRHGMTGDGVFIYDQYRIGAGTSRAGGLPAMPGLGDEARGTVTYGHIFPGMAITMDPTNLIFVRFVPLAVDRTAMEMYFYFTECAMNAPEFGRARDAYCEWWAALNREDEGVCELLQRGRESPAYDGGTLSAYWDTGIPYFSKLVAEAVLRNAERA